MLTRVFVKALWKMLFADEMQVITRIHKNMKCDIMELKGKILLRKRATMETINEVMNIVAALITYFLESPHLI